MFRFFRKNKQQIITINEFGAVFDRIYKNDEGKFINEIYENPFTASALTRINEAINNLIIVTGKQIGRAHV